MTISTVKKDDFQSHLFFVVKTHKNMPQKERKTTPKRGFSWFFCFFFLCVLTEISLKSHRNFFFVELHGCTTENRFFQEKSKNAVRLVVVFWFALGPRGALMEPKRPLRSICFFWEEVVPWCLLRRLMFYFIE